MTSVVIFCGAGILVGIFALLMGITRDPLLKELARVYQGRYHDGYEWVVLYSCPSAIFSYRGMDITCIIDRQGHDREPYLLCSATFSEKQNNVFYIEKKERIALVEINKIHQVVKTGDLIFDEAYYVYCLSEFKDQVAKFMTEDIMRPLVANMVLNIKVKLTEKHLQIESAEIPGTRVQLENILKTGTGIIDRVKVLS